MSKANHSESIIPSPSAETEILSGSEVLIRSLIAEGVEVMFGYPGGAIMPIFRRVRPNLLATQHSLRLAL